MKNINYKPLDPVEAQKWAQEIHILFLDALMSESRWSANQITFHGGTSLSLSWQSARFSEDLDFLLCNDVTDINNTADPDLKKWLPANLWHRLYPDEIKNMIDFSYKTIISVADAIDSLDQILVEDDSNGPR